MATSPDVPGAEPFASDDALGEGPPTASVAQPDEAGFSPYGDPAPPPTCSLCAAGDLQHTPGGGIVDPTPIHLSGCYNCGNPLAAGHPTQHTRTGYLTTEFLATWHRALSRASAVNPVGGPVPALARITRPLHGEPTFAQWLTAFHEGAGLCCTRLIVMI